ncbi:MAG: hypothetical protein WAV07_18970 [Candidatus Contendobacter sp.]
MQRLTEAIERFPKNAEKQLPRTDTKRYLIEQLREPLRAILIERGYSLPELVALLHRCGITIHLSTLKRHLGSMGPTRAANRHGLAGDSASPADPAAYPAPTPTAPAAPMVPLENRPPIFRPAAAPESARCTEHPVADKNAPPAKPAIPLSGRFTPRPELPYDELIRQSEQRKQRLAEAAAGPGEDAAGRRKRTG